MGLQLDLEPWLTLDTDYEKAKLFVVVGSGGTASYFVPNLVRQLSIQNILRKIEGLPLHKVILVDADEVSDSNLKRQNFISKDLEQNKAKVLATRYGAAFETNRIAYLPDYITSSEQLFQLVLNGFSYKYCEEEIPVLVDCVDNNKTRVFIHEAALRLSSMMDVYSLSSGNEFYTGQVVCGFIPKGELSNYAELNKFRLPMVTDMFPEILEGGDKLPTELSCDEAAISHPQNIMTNITAATLLFNFANILMTARTTNADNPGLKYYAQTFDTQTGSMNRFPNKKSKIDFYLEK